MAIHAQALKLLHQLFIFAIYRSCRLTLDDSSDFREEVSGKSQGHGAWMRRKYEKCHNVV